MDDPRESLREVQRMADHVCVLILSSDLLAIDIEIEKGKVRDEEMNDAALIRVIMRTPVLVAHPFAPPDALDCGGNRFFPMPCKWNAIYAALAPLATAPPDSVDAFMQNNLPIFTALILSPSSATFSAACR
jgi:hypothetical protein